MSLGKINSVRFCDIHGGLNDINRIVICKKYNGMDKTYSEWYEFLKDDFELGDKKDIVETESEEIIESEETEESESEDKTKTKRNNNKQK